MTMTGITIGIAALTMLIMAIVMSYILGWASKKFHVDVDTRVEAVLDLLPGANCGGCGYLGCSEYAVAVVTDGAPVHKCPVGGEACAVNIASIMGVDAGANSDNCLPVRINGAALASSGRTRIPHASRTPIAYGCMRCRKPSN